MTTQVVWSAREGASFVVTWGVMMAAMMLPSALPMMLLYRTVSGKLRCAGERAIPPLAFASVYLAVWLVVGMPVYAAGVIVARVAQHSAGTERALPYCVAAVLLAAGAYQLSSFKRDCLRKCKSPLQFLTERWRSGYAATLGIAVSHSLYCIGCCAALMTILVVAGAMSFVWVVVISVLVFAEKILPYGERTARLTGVALLALGAAVIVHPDIENSLRGMPAVTSAMAMP